MAFDEHLANRVRELLSGERGIQEKTMFGGLAFLLDGHMTVVVTGKGWLMMRVPPEQTEDLLRRAHVSPMVMSGREIRGWVRVADTGLGTTRQLRAWVDRSVAHAKTLPPSRRKLA